MRCPSCQHDNPAGARFCAGCGQSLPAAEARFCSRCGGQLASGSQFCPHCGSAVAGTAAPSRPVADDFPARMLPSEDLRRSRLTVFFRLLLVIPHGLYLFVWGLAVGLAVVAGWFATLVAGQLPGGLHSFNARYLRYATRVGAYVELLADPYPPFGSGGSYPVDFEIDPPARQRRWTVLLRIFLALPPLIVIGLVNFTFRWSSSTSDGRTVTYSLSIYSLYLVLLWLFAVVMGRIPAFSQRFGQWYLRLRFETSAYLFLLHDRWPRIGGPPS